MNTKTVKTIEQTVAEMLVENTGVGLCDSGGTSGRSWQRNAGKKLKDFRAEPSAKWEDGYYTISLFHYLASAPFSFDKLCERFNRANSKAKEWGNTYYGVSKKGLAILEEVGAKEAKRGTFNSYNAESALSQVIQGTWLDVDGEDYLLLQIHGGADVRGGYTNARLFKVSHADEWGREDVYGDITKKDGTIIRVDNMYNGNSLTTEDGREVEVEEGDKVSIELMGR